MAEVLLNLVDKSLNSEPPVIRYLTTRDGGPKAKSPRPRLDS